jgi:aryl-alcohol dehydrogenase-like predicted oxidoreductase
VSLTNFDTIRLRHIVEDANVNVVSNQVSFSLIDERPSARGMTEFCEKTGIRLLCYGSLLGGFLSDRWLGQPDPILKQELLDTSSLKKYYRFILQWGGGRSTAWTLFQELLTALRAIADRHQAVEAVVSGDGTAASSRSITVADVAIRWVLQQRGVGGVIVGARLGHTMMNHVTENANVFSFELSDEDLAVLRVIQNKGSILPGDCGDEYRS